MMRILVAAVIVLMLPPLTAVAQAEPAGVICVRCESPQQTYRCEVSAPAGGFKDDRTAQVLCMTRIARDNGHATCAVRANAASGCEGVTVSYAIPESGGMASSPAPNTPGLPSLGAAEEQQQRTSDGKPDPGKTPAPKTMLETTGEAVGNAAKTTWNCVTSLFAKCP